VCPPKIYCVTFLFVFPFPVGVDSCYILRVGFFGFTPATPFSLSLNLLAFFLVFALTFPFPRLPFYPLGSFSFFIMDLKVFVWTFPSLWLGRVTFFLLPLFYCSPFASLVFLFLFLVSYGFVVPPDGFFLFGTFDAAVFNQFSAFPSCFYLPPPILFFS